MNKTFKDVLEKYRLAIVHCGVKSREFTQNQAEAELKKVIKIDEGKLRRPIVDTINKEKLRNTGDKGHPYSDICSCGNCHLADLLTNNISSHLAEIIDRGER